MCAWCACEGEKFDRLTRERERRKKGERERGRERERERDLHLSTFSRSEHHLRGTLVNRSSSDGVFGGSASMDCMVYGMMNGMMYRASSCGPATGNDLRVRFCVFCVAFSAQENLLLASIDMTQLLTAFRFDVWVSFCPSSSFRFPNTSLVSISLSFVSFLTRCGLWSLVFGLIFLDVSLPFVGMCWFRVWFAFWGGVSQFVLVGLAFGCALHLPYTT